MRVNRYYRELMRNLAKVADYPTNLNIAMVNGFMYAETDEDAFAKASGWTFFVFCLSCIWGGGSGRSNPLTSSGTVWRGRELPRRAFTRVWWIESERDALFQRDAHDPEFFSLFLELFRRVAQELEPAGVVQRFQDVDRTLEKGHCRETGRDQDQIKVARRKRVASCPRAEGDRLERRQAFA